MQQQRQRILHHLPGRPLPGSTGEVRRVLSARNFVEVLGLQGGGGGTGGGSTTTATATSTVTAASFALLDDDAVKRSWRALVKSVHPDKHQRQNSSSNGENGGGSGNGRGNGNGVGAEEAFGLVTEAFESLKDAGCRARYARSLGLLR